MSASLFGVFRLGRDARLIDGQNGKFASLNLAYDVYDASAENKRATQWVSATLNGQRAERLAEHLTKGTFVEAIINDVRPESYTTKDGKQGLQLHGQILRIDFAGAKREDGNGAAAKGGAPAHGADDPF